MTFDEIKQAISDHIHELQVILETYQSQYKLIEASYTAFADAIGKAVSDLKSATDSEKQTLLYYLIKDAVIKHC